MTSQEESNQDGCSDAEDSPYPASGTSDSGSEVESLHSQIEQTASSDSKRSFDSYIKIRSPVSLSEETCPHNIGNAQAQITLYDEALICPSELDALSAADTSDSHHSGDDEAIFKPRAMKVLTWILQTHRRTIHRLQRIMMAKGFTQLAAGMQCSTL